jgi:hypothetical protein
VGAAHVDDVVLHDEIPPLDEVDAHLPGQEGVLEEGRVHRAGREQHHHRVFPADRRAVTERLAQQMGIVADGTDGIGREELGEDAVQEVAVLEDVGHPARDPTVVLQH